jgi:hypothetical protein
MRQVHRAQGLAAGAGPKQGAINGTHPARYGASMCIDGSGTALLPVGVVPNPGAAQPQVGNVTHLSMR